MTGFNCRIDEAWLYRLTRRHPRFWFLWYLKHGKECDWKLSRMWRTLSLFLPPDPLCCLLRALLRVIIWALPNQHLACKIPLSFLGPLLRKYSSNISWFLSCSSLQGLGWQDQRSENPVDEILFQCLTALQKYEVLAYVVQIVQSRKQLRKLGGHL